MLTLLNAIGAINFNKEYYNRPIPPEKQMDNWKNKVVYEKHPLFNEPLVPIGIFSKYFEIFSDGIYFGERQTSPYKLGELHDALLSSFVRESVAKRLVEASNLLPSRCVFMTLDAYRKEKVQTILFERYKNELMDPPWNLSEEDAEIATEKHVSQPSKQNSPHMSGGAVDITIIEFNDEASWEEYQKLTQKLKLSRNDDRKIWNKNFEIEMRRSQLLRENTKMLDMGVAFDQIAIDSQKSNITFLRYYEKKLEEKGFISDSEKAILMNRRLLYNVLTKVGFTFYPYEVWHADYGDKFWAQQSGEKAFYGYIELSRENMEHEENRRKIYNAQFKRVIQKFGDPTYSSQPELRAWRICPTLPTHI